MSMLAERKRKQKWSLNPRGKDWAQDANKFGQKMLEKMGWQLGKGLGAKEDGITEHVKISYKNDSKGMGYKETNDQWTEHETNFSALLESLTGKTEKGDELKVHSLEKKSETSRARVHYHKFTRGKDLSRYSEKDLANIFGKKTLKEPKKEEVKNEPGTSNMEKLEKDSQFLVNAGSMKDYFKKKLPNFGKSNEYVVGSNGVLKRGDSDSESDVRPSFSFNGAQASDTEEATQYTGFGFNSEVINEQPKKNPTFVSYINDNGMESDKTKKKKKRKAGETEESTPNKKSKHDAEDQINVGVPNPAFNPMYTPVKMQKHILTTIEETFSEEVSGMEENSVKTIETEVEVHEVRDNSIEGTMKKKKKKKVGNVETSVTEEFELNSVCETGPDDEMGYKKKKKKNKSEPGIDNSNFEEISLESIDNSQRDRNPFEVQLEDCQKTKKKKKKKSELCVENPCFNGSGEDTTDFSVEAEENPYEVQAPAKSKKKKKNKEASAMENPSFNGEIEDISRCKNDMYEVKLKKKKDKRNIENCSSEDVSEVSNTEDAGQKKKKKRKETAAIENPAFDKSLEEVAGVTPIEENPYEVKKKKDKRKVPVAVDEPVTDEPTSNLGHEVSRKKKKSEAVDNPCFNDTMNGFREFSGVEENPFEVKVKEHFAVDNVNFDACDSSEGNVANNAYEVERKKRKSKKKKKEEGGIANPGLDLDASASEVNGNVSLSIEGSDLMLNVVTTPVCVKSRTVDSEETFSIKKGNVKRRKSVRFSDVTQERIIPNNDDLRNLTEIENRNELFDINTQVLNSSLEERAPGLDNLAFDRHRNRIEENVDSMARTLDAYQAEIENDINEEKLEKFSMDDIGVGEVGNPHGENEKLPDGTKLKFKYAHFTSKKPSFYFEKEMGPKKSYRHLIKGDIVVSFNNTNLHQIDGYAVKSKNDAV